MANFGISKLILTDPVTYAFREAAKMAVGAEALLDSLQIVPLLPDALGESVYAIGTTSRDQLKGRNPLTPEEGVARLAEASNRGRVTLLFGGEKRGLSDDELALCQDVVVIPTSEVQPSMNLSQSVAVMLYLCARQDQEVDPSPAAPVDPGARLVTLNALEERLGGLLLESGFLNPQAPEHARRELIRSLARAKLTQREAEMWLSACQHLRRAVKKDG
jgi:tRNA/rRNA methyltransferase